MDQNGLDGDEAQCADGFDGYICRSEQLHLNELRLMRKVLTVLEQDERDRIEDDLSNIPIPEDITPLFAYLDWPLDVYGLEDIRPIELKLDRDHHTDSALSNAPASPIPGLPYEESLADQKSGHSAAISGENESSRIASHAAPESAGQAEPATDAVIVNPSSGSSRIAVRESQGADAGAFPGVRGGEGTTDQYSDEFARVTAEGRPLDELTSSAAGIPGRIEIKQDSALLGRGGAGGTPTSADVADGDEPSVVDGVARSQEVEGMPADETASIDPPREPGTELRADTVDPQSSEFDFVMNCLSVGECSEDQPSPGHRDEPPAQIVTGVRSEGDGLPGRVSPNVRLKFDLRKISTCRPGKSLGPMVENAENVTSCGSKGRLFSGFAPGKSTIVEENFDTFGRMQLTSVRDFFSKPVTPVQRNWVLVIVGFADALPYKGVPPSVDLSRGCYLEGTDIRFGFTEMNDRGQLNLDPNRLLAFARAYNTYEWLRRYRFIESDSQVCLMAHASAPSEKRGAGGSGTPLDRAVSVYVLVQNETGSEGRL